jgi:AraC-like DNA-binding protein
MRYAEYAASPRFARVVDAYWILEGQGCGDPDAILPDGRVELIFHYGAPFSRHRPDGRIERQSNALVAGQALAPVVLSHRGSAGVAGVRVRPAAARTLLGFPVNEITGEIEDLALLDSSARTLCDRLGEARDDQERIGCLERWLAGRQMSEPRVEVEAAVDLIHRSGGRADIAALAGSAGTTVRSLERRFTEDVGLTPKRLARIVRLQRALRHVRSGSPLAGTALACGYYDQSHMALDFSQLALVSPGEWRTHAGVLAPLFAGCDRV